MADIDIGKISEALNDKVDRNMRNVDTSVSDSVIAWQEPTAENGYTWYRKYASGWVEQGGYLIATSDSQVVTITLPIVMFDDKYNCNVSFWFAGTGTAGYQFLCPRQVTTTSFVTTIYKTSSQGSSWYVSGKSA